MACDGIRAVTERGGCELCLQLNDCVCPYDACLFSFFFSFPEILHVMGRKEERWAADASRERCVILGHMTERGQSWQ